MPSQSGASEIKPGNNWINRGKRCDPLGLAGVTRFAIVMSMTKLLEEVIAKVRALPEEDQDALATLLLAVTNDDASAVPLDARTRAAIREGLAQAERGEFVPDEVVAEADKRHGI